MTSVETFKIIVEYNNLPGEKKEASIFVLYAFGNLMHTI